MFSPAKKEDKKFLLELADLIELLVRLGQNDLAQRYGEWYLEIEQKIKTFDYSDLDKHYEPSQTTP